MKARIPLKVCGVTRAAEMDVLGALGVDYAGVWHGVGGRAERPLAHCHDLIDAGRAAGVEPVLVTFISDPARLRDLVCSSGVGWLQLHGFQTPATVAAVRRGSPDGTRIIKVLHVQGSACAEEAVIPAYERAGVDVLLFDSIGPGGRLGSTGVSLEPEAVAALMPRLSRPFMLAGGLTAGADPALVAIAHDPACVGIDVDTGARGGHGAIDAANVKAIRDAFNGEPIHH